MEKTILVKSKKDLVNRVSVETGLSKSAAQTAVNAVFDEIIETLADGGEISIAGFGKFEVTKRAARTGINPLTKEKIDIPAMKAVHLKPAKNLKESINK